MNAVSKINPWTARPLTEASKNSKFRAVMDLSAERVILGRSAIIAGWTVGGVGVACFAASIFGWITVLPLHTVETKVLVSDQNTGIISKAISLEDAPKTFGAATEHQYIKRYIEAHDSWVPQMEERNDYIVKIMSSPAEQARYSSAHNGPNGPIKTLGKDGQAHVENFRYHPLAMGSDGETRRYLVQFDRIEWHGTTREPTKSWSATIDFQWHPTLPMSPGDRDDNPGGFQEISYSATPDTPDQRRQ